MDARRSAKSGLWMALLLILALAVAACAGGERSLSQVEQQLEGGGEETGNDDFGMVALTCPKEPVPVKLAIAHSFNFSPNRETDVYSVNGTTDPNAWCMITVAGSKVTAEPCNFSYHYDGFIKGEDAMCQITGNATAALEITGRCEDGRVFLELSEYANDEGLTGKMNCPGAPAVDFGTAYPLSLTEASFSIASLGDTVTASADPDQTGQFSYSKSWTLIFTPDVFGQ